MPIYLARFKEVDEPINELRPELGAEKIWTPAGWSDRLNKFGIFDLRGTGKLNEDGWCILATPLEPKKGLNSDLIPLTSRARSKKDVITNRAKRVLEKELGVSIRRGLTLGRALTEIVFFEGDEEDSDRFNPILGSKRTYRRQLKLHTEGVLGSEYSPPRPATQTLSDDFETYSDNDYLDEVGSDWTGGQFNNTTANAPRSSQDNVGNQGMGNQGTNVAIGRHVTMADSADQYARIYAIQRPNHSVYWIAAMVQMASDLNTMYYFSASGSRDPRIYKRVSGTSTEIASDTNNNPDNAEWMALEKDGSDLEAFLDWGGAGQVSITATDSSITAERGVGFGSYSQNLFISGSTPNSNNNRALIGEWQGGDIDSGPAAQEFDANVAEFTHEALSCTFDASTLLIDADIAEFTHEALSVVFQSTGTDQNIDANVAEFTHEALSVGFVSGLIAIDANVAEYAHEALATSFDVSPITIDVNVSEFTHEALAASFNSGVNTIDANIAEFTHESSLVTFDAGGQSIDANVAAFTHESLPVAFVQGSITIPANVAGFTHQATTVTFTSEGIIAAGIAEFTHEALPITFDAGPISIDADVAEFTHTALTLGFDSSNIIDANTAEFTHESLPVTFVAGQLIIPANVAEFTHETLSVTFVAGAQTINVNVAEFTHESLPTEYSAINSLDAGVAEFIHEALNVVFISGSISIDANVAEFTHEAGLIDTGDTKVYPFSLIIYDVKPSLVIRDSQLSVTVKEGTNVTIQESRKLTVTQERSRVRVIY